MTVNRYDRTVCDQSGLCQCSSLRVSCVLSVSSLAFKPLPGYPERCGAAHMLKTPCRDRDVLAHSRPAAQEIPEFVIATAISFALMRWF
jgi:hypothetical protein